MRADRPPVPGEVASPFRHGKVGRSWGTPWKDVGTDGRKPCRMPTNRRAAACPFGDTGIFGIQAIHPPGHESPQCDTAMGAGAITRRHAARTTAITAIGNDGRQARARSCACAPAVAVGDRQAGAPPRRQLVLRVRAGTLADLDEGGKRRQPQQRHTGAQQTHDNLGNGGPGCPAHPCSRARFKNSLSADQTAQPRDSLHPRQIEYQHFGPDATLDADQWLRVVEQRIAGFQGLPVDSGLATRHVHIT